MKSPDSQKPESGSPEGCRSCKNPSRRSFLTRLSGLFMAGGLLAGYGTFFSFAARFLYPAKPQATGWMFLTTLGSMKLGESLTYRTPAGSTVAVARQGNAGTEKDFVALSSTCPHLGCQVHWEAQNDRFFCPCHNGVFTPSGKAISGPPAEAKQSLAQYPLKIEKGLVYINVPLGGVAGDKGTIEKPSGPPGPGHDPVLYAKHFGRKPK